MSGKDFSIRPETDIPYLELEGSCGANQMPIYFYTTGFRIISTTKEIIELNGDDIPTA